LADVKEHVLGDLDRHVERVRKLWDRDYNPDDHFAQFKSSVEIFAKAISSEDEIFAIRNRVNTSIRSAVWSMESEYVPNDTTATPTQQSVAKADSLEELFRDVDG